MHAGRRLLLLVILPAWLLSACGGFGASGSTSGSTNLIGAGAGSGSSSGGSSSGGSSGAGAAGSSSGGFGGVGRINGADDAVVAIPSIQGPVQVALGANQTLAIVFASSDGLTVTALSVIGSPGGLPTGWSGPAAFSCATVGRGNTCVLNLNYAPTAVDSGSLVVNYEFVDNAKIPRTGYSISIPYAATLANNIDAVVSSTGEIDAVAGLGLRSVGISFVTDDGTAATNFAVTTDLANLPAGWLRPPGNLACAVVTSGGGCRLALGFAPQTAAHGTLTVAYAYTDNVGAARTGAINVPYATLPQNVVDAAATPAGQVVAVQKTGGQAVTVTFTTDDGKPASSLSLTSSLTALPAGWASAAKSFACAAVATGNGCQLHLTYAPSGLGGGTLPLTYTYVDGAGMPGSAVLNIGYAATSDDNVVGTATPSGQINAVVGQGAQSVAVTFTTDDRRTSTDLLVAGDLAALPAGWSSAAGTFGCSAVAAGSGCQLTLTYAPTAAGSGTVNLSYQYQNNGGIAKTGTVPIPFRATTNDNVVGTPSVANLAVASGTSTVVSISFATDDGNPASQLLITSGLAALPAGWSGAPATFGCAMVAVAGCQLTLTYAPVTADSGTLTLGYGYLDDSGSAKTGTVNVAYSATP